MNKNDRDIQSLLGGKTELPTVVRKKADAAFDAVRTARQEFGAENEKNTMNRKSSWKVAVAACLAILAVGTTAAAARNYFGLNEYFKWRNKEVPKEAAELINEDVLQNKPVINDESKNTIKEKAENEYVDFRVRQTLCDSQQIVVELEAKPKEQDKYFLMIGDMQPDDNLSDYGLSCDSRDMTIDSYIKEKGLKLLYVNARLDLGEKMGPLTMDFKCEPDGSLIIIETTDNLIHEKEAMVTCDVAVLPPDTADDELNDKELDALIDELLAKGEIDGQPTNEEREKLRKEYTGVQPSDYIRDSFTFKLVDNSIMEQFAYKPEQAEIPGTQIILDEVVVKTTELGTYAEFRYHYNGGSAKELENGWPDIEFEVVDKNGNRLDSGISGVGGGTIKLEDGSYEETRSYGVTELSDELWIEAFALGDDEKTHYGIFKLIKQ